MARNRGKKPLYEVMSKARIKPGPDKTIEQLHPKRSDEDIPEKDKKPVAEKTRTVTQWWNKPKIVQFNGGRIEFSLQYQIAIAIVLGLVLLVLIAYRLGQFSMANSSSAGPIERLENNFSVNPTGQDNRNQMQQADPVTQNPPTRQAAVPAQSTGNNVIVLKEYGARADLELALKFFEENGISTEIVLENGRYFLQTKERYISTNTPGEKGYEMIKRIAEIGSKYKAPSGYENFHFNDAYGKKVK